MLFIIAIYVSDCDRTFVDYWNDRINHVIILNVLHVIRHIVEKHQPL